jgi:4-amino-4-deoxy-L-arabinose transferase-like glycosyltransferase
MSAIRFRLWIIGVATLTEAIQLRFIHASVGSALSPVGRYARAQAFWMVRGDWFVGVGHGDPSAPARSASALHPPLTSLLLGAADVASASGVTAQRVMFSLIFCASAVLVGLTVRILAGERAAVLAALIFATLPSLWVNPVTLGSETLVIAVTTLLLFGAVRFREQPSVARAAEIGTYLGLAVVTRTDLVALVVVVGLPLVLLASRVSWVERAKLGGVMMAVAVLIVAPWAARNLATFSRPTLVSDDAGSVLAGANCAITYEGSQVGWWSGECAARAAETANLDPGDQAGVAAAEGSAGRHYARDHVRALIRVAFIRVGRMWDVFHPFEQSRLETTVGRPLWVSDMSVWYLYPLVPLAVMGGAVLRLRHAMVFPFVGLVILSTVTALVAYGDARFRVEADVALAMLGGVALDWLWVRRAQRIGHASPAGAAAA